MSTHKKVPGYALPTINSATRSSVTDEENRKGRAKRGNEQRHQELTDRSTKITSKPPIGRTKNTGRSAKSSSQGRDSTSVFKMDLPSGGSDIASSDTKEVTTGTYKETCTASCKHNIESSHDSPVEKMSASLTTKYIGKTVGEERQDKPSSQSLRTSVNESRFRRSTSNELDYSSLQKEDGDYYTPFDSSPNSLPYETTKSTYTRFSYQSASTSAAQCSELRDNLDFYSGRIRSKPAPGNSIEEMLKWKGDYGILERNHLYIQWLFPIPEGRGLNSQAQQLTEYEAKAIRSDDTTRKRVLQAYKMMLDFYGLKLKSQEDGTVVRCQTNYKERYEHLNRSRHNLYRITRIIKSLGELGFSHFQAPLVFFLHEEAYTKKALPKLKGSCFHHWIDAINDDDYKSTVNRLFHELPIATDKPVPHAKSREVNKEEFSEAESSDDEEDVTEIIKSKKENQTEVKKEKQKHDSNDLYEIENTGHQPVAASSINGQQPSDELNLLQLSVRSGFMDEDVSGIGYSQKNQSDGDKRSDQYGAVAKNTDLGRHMDDEMQNDNLKFYRNDLQSRPSPGYTIETILNHAGDYKFFNDYPCFIQWLFPTPERSLKNPHAQPLYPHEAKAIISDEVTFKRVLRAYQLILDYYGIRLTDDITGDLQKSQTWKSRWEELDKYRFDEFRRITRVLRSLGELGYERYQVPLIKMFIDDGKLNDTDLKGLTWDHVRHWISSIKDKGEREAMFHKYKDHLFSKSRTYTADNYDDTTVLSRPHMDLYSSCWDTGIQFPSF